METEDINEGGERKDFGFECVEGSQELDEGLCSSQNYTLPFSDVLRWESFSVQVDVSDIPRLKEVLSAFPESEYQKLYLKRGVNDRGRVGNDVETEQIVLDEESGSCKGKMSSVVQIRGSIALFWSQEASTFSPKPDIICMKTSGVLRTNCIDCLDRTNVAQYAYGLQALGRQLHAMGLTDVPKVDPDSSIAVALLDMYQSMGDALAQQYGGSDAHNTPDQRPGGVSGNSGVAPDAAEIQLKSPNWLFGQRKYEEGSSAAKVASRESDVEGSQANGFCDLNWLSSGNDMNEEDVFQRYLTMTSTNEANGWYGGSLLGDQDESSEIYKHYAELCQIMLVGVKTQLCD
ncbi:hypothetical protein JHK82_055646 [Glycine max]|nr:hypothetical protein JHK86_055476 [Glycine max]KAG4918207.1 hypothetical protein JHK85_056488 [Glycine max]KAG5074286.1 hypothetical protein JHK84_055517 [Glycine max]KAG5076951.1 hypothetical protein JHK82_055646 [Glycine max]